MPPVYETLLLNTAVPQIQAAQAGDSYVMVVNATTPALRITQTGTGDSILVEDAANPDSSPFVVTAGGDVGIGATTPAYKLDVQGGLARSQNSGGINNGYLITTNSSNAAARNWAVLSNSNAFGDFVIRQGNSLGSDPVSGTDRLVIDASGNLGLGVTNGPSTWSLGKAFQVNSGALWSQSNVSYVSANSYYNLGYKYLNDGYATIYESGGGSHIWYTSGPVAGSAGASFTPTQAMTLDASGRLLVGATSASSGARATLTSAAQASGAACADSGILLYPTANLATGEYAPFITWSGNFTNPNRARAAIGAVSSSTSTALDLVFLTRSAADASEIGTGSERARITSGGYFKASNTGSYVGSTGTYHELRSDANETTVIVQNTSATLTQSVNGIQINYSGASPNGTSATFLYCNDSTALRASIRSNGGLANYQSNNVDLSDARTKTDINPLGSYWSKIAGLEIVTYKYKDQTHDDLNIGVIAQQVETVAPEFVDSDGFGDTPEDGVPLKTIYNKDLTFAAIKALQEAMARIETLEAKIAALEAK